MVFNLDSIIFHMMSSTQQKIMRQTKKARKTSSVLRAKVINRIKLRDNFDVVTMREEMILINI